MKGILIPRCESCNGILYPVNGRLKCIICGIRPVTEEKDITYNDLEVEL